MQCRSLLKTLKRKAEVKKSRTPLFGVLFLHIYSNGYTTTEPQPGKSNPLNTVFITYTTCFNSHPVSPVLTTRTARFSTQQFYILPRQLLIATCTACQQYKGNALFRIHGNSGYANVSCCYIIRTVPCYNREEVCLLRGTDWVFIYCQV